MEIMRKELFLGLVIVLFSVAHGSSFQKPKDPSLVITSVIDLNAIDETLDTQQKIATEVIEKSKQEVETVVHTLEESDKKEAEDVKKLLGFLNDVKIAEVALVRRKRQVTSSNNNCTSLNQQLQQANYLADRAQILIDSVSPGINSATATMHNLKSNNGKSDRVRQNINLKLADITGSMISVLTSTQSSLQNALFQLTYASYSIQNELVLNECANSIAPKKRNFVFPF